MEGTKTIFLEEEKKQLILDVFDSIDRTRLAMYGPECDGNYFTHGYMLGIRETLETKGIHIDKVTGIWWYEELSKKRGRSFQDLVDELQHTQPDIIEKIASGYRAATAFIIGLFG